MRKLFARLLAVTLLASIFMYPSCKKIYHSTNPQPVNYRLKGYTKITTTNYVPALSILFQSPVVTETFSFSYDNSNRLLQTLYSTNDSNQVKIGHAALQLNYTYSGTYIYRSVGSMKTANIIEWDTFNTNANGQIVTSEFTTGLWPIESHTYNYAASLLDNETDVYSDSGTSISASSTFTSYTGDLLYQYFNGTLTASFPDSGIRPDITAADTVRDSILTYPLAVTWTQYPLGLPLPVTSTSTSGDNTNPTTTLSGYSQNLVTVDAVDPNGIFVRTATFPAGLNASKQFVVYSDLNDRQGDYLQLKSFTTYGVNIYANKHMIKLMKTAFETDSAGYNIDAQSNVTQTIMVKTDKYGNVTTEQYNLVYETY